jgi:hypothetical protein
MNRLRNRASNFCLECKTCLLCPVEPDVRRCSKFMGRKAKRHLLGLRRLWSIGGQGLKTPRTWLFVPLKYRRCARRKAVKPRHDTGSAGYSTSGTPVSSKSRTPGVSAIALTRPAGSAADMGVEIKHGTGRGLSGFLFQVWARWPARRAPCSDAPGSNRGRYPGRTAGSGRIYRRLVGLAAI